MTVHAASARTRSRLALPIALVAVVSLLPLVGSNASAAANQRTLFDHTGSQTASSYWEPSVDQPSSYLSPTNLAEGHTYLKLKVTSKPSSKAMRPQLCFWRHAASRFQFETCSPSRKLTFTDEGTYYVDLGAATSWWKKNGRYDWSKRASVIRIMLKDPATGKLFLGSRCGAACYKGDDLDNHVPVRYTGEVIMVAKGATLSPPADWTSSCPSSWSPQCRGGGGDGGGGGGGGGGEDGGGGSAVTVRGNTSTAPTVTVKPAATSLTISWKAVPKAKRYQVKWKPVRRRTKWEPVTTTRSMTVRGLQADTIHVVEVRALVGSSWRGWTRVRISTT